VKGAEARLDCAGVAKVSVGDEDSREWCALEGVEF